MAVFATAILASGCGGSSSAATPTAAASLASSAVPSPTACVGATELHWFTGLGGTTKAQQAAAQEFVRRYNAGDGCRAGIALTLEIAEPALASDILKTEIAAGKSPDLVGPLGVADMNGFEGLFVDLTEQIAKNHIDLGAYDPGAAKVLQPYSWCAGGSTAWTVLDEMATRPALPSHESSMPSRSAATGALDLFLVQLRTTPGLDLNKAITELLQQLFLTSRSSCLCVG